MESGFTGKWRHLANLNDQRSHFVLSDTTNAVLRLKNGVICTNTVHNGVLSGTNTKEQRSLFLVGQSVVKMASFFKKNGEFHLCFNFQFLKLFLFNQNL